MDNQIARTIYQQIRDSRITNEPFMTNFFQTVKATQIVSLEDGIQFRVKGDKFSGKVVIRLNAMDTYDIQFWNVQMEPFICEKVDEINDIYNNQLLETLWRRIVEI